MRIKELSHCEITLFLVANCSYFIELLQLIYLTKSFFYGILGAPNSRRINKSGYTGSTHVLVLVHDHLDDHQDRGGRDLHPGSPLTHHRHRSLLVAADEGVGGRSRG